MTASHCFNKTLPQKSNFQEKNPNHLLDRQKLIKFLADQYDGLVLDNDGTVARTEELHALVGAKIMSEHGAPTSFDDRFCMMGMGEAAIWDAQRDKGMPLTLGRQQFIDMHQEEFLKALETHKNPAQLERHGVIDLVQAFKDRSKPVGVASNTPRNVVERVQRLIGFWEKMDVIVTFDDLQALNMKAKPEPDAYNLAKEKMGLQNGKVLAVEDSSKGISSAISAGCDVIGIYYDTIGHKPDPRVFLSTRDSSRLFLEMK